LGGFEHLHWLFSQSGPRAFAHAMEVTGTTTVKQWRAALDALQLSQPFFSVLIDVDDDNRPYFRRVNSSPIPMRVLDGKFAASWEDEMGKEVSTMIPAMRTVTRASRSIARSSSRGQSACRPGPHRSSPRRTPTRSVLSPTCPRCVAP